MRDIDSLCTKCWSELTQGSVCEECGFDNDIENETTYLAKATVLQGKYVVGAMINRESDSATYSGYDGMLDKPVIIREFLPKGMANRLEGNAVVHIRQKYSGEYIKLLKSFISLWTTLEKLQSLSAVVPVYDVFEDNGTAYAIIEKMDTISLRDYLLRNEQGYIQWDSARLMFMPVLTTIEALHNNGIIHGSITPDTLLLCRDGKVRLAPFPIQQSCDSSSVLEFCVSEGYTALEQYDNNHKIGTATDIYSFTACIYRALVGSNPPSALSRETNDKLMIPNAIAETIPMHVIKAMGSGLQVYPEKRIKDISDYRDLLDAAPAVQAKAAQPVEDIYQEGATGGYPDYDSAPKTSTKSKVAIVILVILIIAAIVAGVYVIRNQKQNNSESQATITTTAVQKYEVPNLANVGFTRDDIESNPTWTKNFTFTYHKQYSTDVKEGIIFEQSVEPGEKVDAKTEIILTISQGERIVEVPDVSNLDLQTAKKELEDQGFVVSTVEVYNDGSHTKDTIKVSFGIAPEEGTEVAYGSEIILQVYGEPQPQEENVNEIPVDTEENE